MTTAFLKPAEMNLPPQGAWTYHHEVRLYESDTAAGLESAINSGQAGIEGDVDNWWIIKSIEYQVQYKPNPMARMSYSALVHGVRAQKV